MAGTTNTETPGTAGGDRGSRGAVLLGGVHRRLRNSNRLRSSHVSADPPELGALAREAVVSFLHGASIATAGREGVRGESAVTGTGAATTVGTGVRNGAGEADGISAAAKEPLPGKVAAGAGPSTPTRWLGGRRR